MEKAKTAQQLKEHFLEKAAPLLDQYIGATFGEAALTSVDSTCREEVWGMLKDFLSKADEKIILEGKYREGPEGVLLAVMEGHITIEEGERLIDMHKKIKDIAVAGNPNALNQTLIPSLTINTTNNSTTNELPSERPVKVIAEETDA